jgi:hypothetical protein
MPVCEICGEPMQGRGKSHRTCRSESATKRAVRERRIFEAGVTNCAWCGKELAGRSDKKYCSRKCKRDACYARSRNKGGKAIPPLAIPENSDASETAILLDPEARSRVKTSLKGPLRPPGMSPRRWGELKNGPSSLTVHELRIIEASYPGKFMQPLRLPRA